MIRRGNQARDEMLTAREHLRSAAERSARRAGDTSRRTGEVARKRAKRAARAVRGEEPPARWRWMGAGLAAGAALGAIGVAALRRARQTAGKTTPEQVRATVREKAGTAVEAVRDRTSTVAHRTAEGARHTVAKAREASQNHDRTGTDGAPPDAESTKSTKSTKEKSAGTAAP